MFPEIDIVKKDLQTKTSFFERLTQYDLIARHAQSNEHYKRFYVNSIIAFTKEEKEILTDLIQKVNLFTRKYPLLHKIPWNLVKLSKGVENDYPHTLDGYIMLPYDFVSKHLLEKGQLTTDSKKSLVKTLLHEKIHVFQRKYPYETRLLIEDLWEFKPVKENNDSLRRTNPDTNDTIYERHDSTCFQKYNHQLPTALSDSTINTECVELYEHPYEQMAYILSELLIDNTFKSYDYIAGLKWLDRIHKSN